VTSERNSLESRTVRVYDKKIEVSSAGIVEVRREDHPLVAREEERGKVRGTIARQLSLVRTICVAGEDFHLSRFDKLYGKQAFVLSDFFGGRRVIRAIHDLSAVPGKESSAVISKRMGDSLDV